jgi:hypothetical protein
MESTMVDYPPSNRLGDWAELACGADGIIYTGGFYNTDSGGGPSWQQYFPKSIVAGESWISQVPTYVSPIAVWAASAPPGQATVYYETPNFNGITTVSSTSATANGFSGLVQLVTTFTFSSMDQSWGPGSTMVGLEDYSLVVTDYWLPGTGFVEEDTTETYPVYTDDPTTGIPYVSGTAEETWTITLVSASG